MGIFKAAALVHGDVNEHRAGLHPGHEVVGDELGCLGARDQDGADDEISIDNGLFDLV
ncbi:hypothetical protein D3C87_2183320 [compost metagenome]